MVKTHSARKDILAGGHHRRGRTWKGYVMEAMMDGIDKHAAFYRAYLPHDRSVIPVAVALGAIVALWLSLYCVSAERTPQIVQKEARAAAVLVCRPVSH
jgi:hypothetical protein